MLIKIRSKLGKAGTILGYASFAGLFAITVFTMVSIVLRYCFLSPIKGSTEILEVSLAAMVFAGVTYTQVEKGHIHVMMLLNILPKRLGSFLYAFNSLLSTICIGGAAYACFQQGQYALRKTLVSVILRIPF